MARKTPDYTKQARRSSRPSGAQSRRPAGGPQTRRPAQGKQGVSVKDAVEATEIPKLMLMSSITSILGGVVIMIWGMIMAAPSIGSAGLAGRSAVVISVGMLGGVLCNLFVTGLLLQTYDARRFSFGGLSMKTFIYGFMITGIISFVIIFSSGTMAFFGLALAPAAVVFYFVIRPRLKARAVVEGRYKPKRRETAREEYLRERDQLRAEKERYERLKAARLGTGKGAKPAAASAGGSRTATGGSRKTAASGSGRRAAKGRPQT